MLTAMPALLCISPPPSPASSAAEVSATETKEAGASKADLPRVDAPSQSLRSHKLKHTQILFNAYQLLLMSSSNIGKNQKVFPSRYRQRTSGTISQPNDASRDKYSSGKIRRTV